MLTRLRALDPNTRRWSLAALALAVVVGLPLLLSGPGNDLDVANIFRSGRSIALHGSYVPSRAPGAPIQETVVGVLDRLGGARLAAAASLVAAAVFVVALDRLLAGEGLGVGRRWGIALVVANPWFVVAATSTVDYVFALAFVVLAALAIRRNRPVLAGLAAAASMGCRIGSALLIGALLLAELTDRRAAEPDAEPGPDADPSPTFAAALRRVALVAAVAAVGTVMVFVPSYLHAGGLTFARNDFSTSSPFTMLGRAAVKDLTLLGPVASVVALAAVPALIGVLRGWRASWLVRFSVVGFALSQLLFIRFPWKMPHLLPCLLCLGILLAIAFEARPRLLITLVALQLLFGVVSVNLIAPNHANEATGGRFEPSIGWGPVVTDLRCRRDHPDVEHGRQKVEVEAAWNCSQPFDR